MQIEKKNIFLSNTAIPLAYASPSSGRGELSIPPRTNRIQHGSFLKKKFNEAYKENLRLSQGQVAAIKYKDGVYLEFSGQANHDLVLKSLEDTKQGVRLLNVRTDEDTNTIKATVYVPEGKETLFINKIDDYLSKNTPKGNPKHKDLVNSVENVTLAFLDAFWFGHKADIPKETPVWCEIWLRADNNVYEEPETSFISICEKLAIEFDVKSIYFPERIVKLIRTNSEQLQELIKSYKYIVFNVN